MRNVAYVISMPHGVEAWTFRELEALVQDGINITLFPLRYAVGPYMPKDEWACYRFSVWSLVTRQLRWLVTRPFGCALLIAEAIQTRTLVDLLLAFDFAHEMRKRNLELIHCVFGDHKLFVGHYCKKLLGIPLSVALYGYELRKNPNWLMFRRAIGAADVIIVNCEFNRKRLAEAAGKESGDRARVVRHYAEVQAGERRDLIRILIVGGFVERKGHDLLFRAVSALGEDAERLEIWVAGYSGPVDVEQLARELGVLEKVRVFEGISERGLDLLFQLCDVFCLPSRTDRDGINEGLPVALIEAMAHGKPVVTTRLGGIPELVEEILVEEGDYVGVARGIKSFMDDAELRRASGERNRAIARSLYTKQNVYAMRDLWREKVEGESRG